jgi:integrating conjugative element protein (TIGR03757 family)
LREQKRYWGWIMSKYILAILGMVSFASVYAANIDIYAPCDADLAQQQNVKVYKVGCNAILDKQMTQALSGVSKSDTDTIQKKVNDFMRDHLQSYMQANQTNQEALNNGITQYPAIVFDGKYVVYGTLNVTQALQLYNNYMRGVNQ